MGDSSWMYGLGIGPGLFGSAKDKAKNQQAKYEENRRRAMEAYQADLNRYADELQGAYAPNAAETGNVVRRYGVAGQEGGARSLYEANDPEFNALYRQQALAELQNPAMRYDESVNDILGRIEEEAASGAVGRGVYGSGLHAQDYSKRGLQTLVPFRMQAITNALNRGENFAKTLELVRAQAVNEYEPVRARETEGASQAANLRATGSATKYGTEAEIAGAKAGQYNARQAALYELAGKGATMAVGAMTGNPAAAASAAGGGGAPSLSAYELALSDPNYFGPDTSSFGASPEEMNVAYNRSQRERNPYGVR